MGARTKIITLALYGDIVTVLSINLKYSSSYQSSFEVCPWFVTAEVRSQKECLSISHQEKKLQKSVQMKRNVLILLLTFQTHLKS